MSAKDDWLQKGTAAERMLHGSRATDEMARGGSVANKYLEDERRRRALIDEALGSATAMASALKRDGRTTDAIIRGASVADRFIEEERRMRAMIDGSGRSSMGAAAAAMKAQRGMQDAIAGVTGGSLIDKATREALDGGIRGRAEREAFGGSVTGEAMREALQASLAGHADTEARLAGYPGAADQALRMALGTGVAATHVVGTTTRAPARGRKEAPELVTERRHSAHVQVYAPGEPIDTPAALGTRIRAARRGMGMNQQRFADLAGVGRRFLSEVEAGKPGAEFGKVLACCAAAGIDLFARTR